MFVKLCHLEIRFHFTHALFLLALICLLQIMARNDGTKKAQLV